MKVERAAEPESKGIGVDIVPEIDEAPIYEPRKKAKRVYRVPRNSLMYAKPFSGLVMIVALLFVPMITLPGMIILVLIAEVYLLDWTYSKVGLLRDEMSSISKESDDRSPEDEIDKRVARTNPKDQFVR
jgi:hypothetical protein